MLTAQDIQKLTSLLATKEDVKEIREDVGGLRESLEPIHYLTAKREENTACPPHLFYPRFCSASRIMWQPSTIIKSLD